MDRLTMAALRFPVRYSYTSRLSAGGSAYDTVQLAEAQKKRWKANLGDRLEV
jgi:hypothetical protein